jgi:hypothetical protein
MSIGTRLRRCAAVAFKRRAGEQHGWLIAGDDCAE